MMKNNLITKISLVVAIVALVFSVVTLVRALVDPTFSQNLVMAIIQVAGTSIVVVICGILLHVMRSYDEEDEDDEDEDESEDKDEASQAGAENVQEKNDETPQEAADSPEKEADENSSEDEIDVLLRDIESVDDADYDLENFE